MKFGFSPKSVAPQALGPPTARQRGRREACGIIYFCRNGFIHSITMPAACAGHATPSSGRQIAAPPVPQRSRHRRYEGELMDAQTMRPDCLAAETDGGWVLQDSAPMRPQTGRFGGPGRTRQPGIGTAVVPHHGRKSESLTRAWYAGDSRRFPEGRPRCLNFVWREAEGR